MLMCVWLYSMLCNSFFNIYIWTYKKNPLAFCYVFTNAYRSTFPVMHFTNTCMFMNCSPLIERSASTIAELTFTLQVLNWFRVPNKYKVYSISSIILAEIYCWVGIITGTTFFHILEETIWCANAINLLIWLKISNIDRKSSEK